MKGWLFTIFLLLITLLSFGQANTIVTKNLNVTNTIYLRGIQYYGIPGVVDVTWFGARGDGATNSTAGIQAAIDYLATTSSPTRIVKIPSGISGNGHYMIDSLIIKNGVSIEGASKNTIIEVRGGTASGAFVLDNGAVQKITIKNFTVVGNTSNTGQHCFNFTANPQLIPAFTGGLWYSVIENVDIIGFKGHGFHFFCQDGSGDMANQFLRIQNCHVSATADSSSIPFYAEGQFAQVKIQDCLFDGPGQQNAGTVGISLKSLLTSNDQIQGSISFDNVTIQAVKKGVFTSFASGVSFTNCWWENDSMAIHATNKSRILLEGNVFKNIATNTGFVVGNDLSLVDFIGNGLFGSIVGRVYTSPSGTSGGGRIEGNYGQDHLDFSAVFIGQNFNVVSTTLSTGYFRDIVTNGTTSRGTYINNINSDLGPGEEITIRCLSNSVPGSYVAFSRVAGNVDIPLYLDSGFLVIRARQAATFKRSTLLNTWVLVGLSKPEMYSDTVVTAGSWFSGEKLWNNNPSNGTLYWYCKLGGNPGIWDSVMIAGVGKGNTPTSASLGANVTSITPSGTDMYMKVTIVTSGAVSGTIGNIVYSSSWPHTPIPTISTSDAVTGSAIGSTTGGYISINGINNTTAQITGNISSAGTYIFNIHSGAN